MPFVDTDPRFGSFTLRTDCPRCGEHLPVNSPTPTVVCEDCAHRVDVPGGLLPDVVDTFEKRWPTAEGAGTIIEGDGTWRWTFSVVSAPPCAACGEAMELPEPVTTAGIPCGSCGVINPCSHAPDTLRSKVPTADWVFGSQDDLTRPKTPPQPVALNCPQCGAGLNIAADRARITACDYCDSKVNLPDSVWLQLHPPRVARAWTVRFVGPSLAARKAEKRRKKKERRRKQEERRQKQEAAKAKKAEENRIQKERQERTRRTFGLLSWLASAVLVLGATGTMAGSVLAYAIPDLWTPFGIQGTGARMLSQGVVGLGAASLVVAWFFAVIAAAWRSGVPIVGSLLHSAFHLVMVGIPVVGPLAAVMFAVMYGIGRFPTPMGKAWADHRAPLGNGWPLALLLLVAGPFCTVAEAITFGMTIFEMMARFED